MAFFWGADVRDKQIARTVKGQGSWKVQSGGKGSSYSVWSKFIDLAGAVDREVVEVGVARRHKQIARLVKSQRFKYPGGKGGPYSVRSKFIDGSARKAFL